MSALPAPLTENQKTRRAQRRFIKEGTAPEGAIRWRGNGTRAKALRLWRAATSVKFSARPRCLRVAWTLEWMFGKDGYAFPRDSFIASEIGMSVDHVQEALKDLERGGCIIRASVFVAGHPQRRIWPNIEIIPPDARGSLTPRQQVEHPPVPRGQISQEGKNPQRSIISSTMNDARRAAEINARRRPSRFDDYPEDAA